MIDYKKLYSEAEGFGQVSPEVWRNEKAMLLQHPHLFDSSHPLAFDNAQNTAQRAKDKSDELQEAFKAASEGNFEDLSKFQKPSFDQKSIGTQSVGYEQQPWYKTKDIMKQIEDLTSRPAGRGETLLHPSGRVPLSFEEISRKPGFAGFANLGASEVGPTSTEQTSSSNIAPYGLHEEEYEDSKGNKKKRMTRDVQSNLTSMPLQGLPISRYQT